MPIRRVDTTEIEYNSGDNTYTLPTTRGTNKYVLSRDDSVGTGGTAWKETEVAPITTSITPTEVASASGGNITITLTGANYGASGMTVHFIATSGSDITSGMTITHTSTTSLSVTIAKSSFANANEPYGIKVTKPSGLTHTLANALRVDNAPAWQNVPAGSPSQMATMTEIAATATHSGSINATDAEGDTITYSETTNVLSGGGFSLNTGTGAITGAPSAVTSDTNYDFTLRATSTPSTGEATKTTDQQFRITVQEHPAREAMFYFEPTGINVASGTSNVTTWVPTIVSVGTPANFTLSKGNSSGSSGDLTRVNFNNTSHYAIEQNSGHNGVMYNTNHWYGGSAGSVTGTPHTAVHTAHTCFMVIKHIGNYSAFNDFYVGNDATGDGRWGHGPGRIHTWGNGYDELPNTGSNLNGSNSYNESIWIFTVAGANTYISKQYNTSTNAWVTKDQSSSTQGNLPNVTYTDTIVFGQLSQSAVSHNVRHGAQIAEFGVWNSVLNTTQQNDLGALAKAKFFS